MNHMFKICFEALPKLKVFYECLNQDLISEAENSLKQIKTKFEDRKISLVMVGSYCSGKTTLINALLNSMLISSDSPEKWMEILPAKEIENTSSYSFLSAVPNSPDFDKNCIYIQVDDALPEKVSEKKELREQILDLNKYFMDLEKKNDHIFFQLKKTKNLAGDLPKIHIYFPKINNSLQIIDTPGISTESFQNELRKIVESEACLFLYVKNLDSSQVNSQDVMEFFKISQKLYNGNYQFWMVFTKEDKFLSTYLPADFDEDENINQKKKEKKSNFQKFLQLTEKEIVENQLKINKIYVISTLAAFRPNHKFCHTTQGSIRKLLIDILNFKEKNGDYFVKLIYLDRMKQILETFNKKLNQQTKISPEIIEDIKMKIEFIADFYTDKMREVLKKEDFVNLEKFQKAHPDSYEKCVKKIERTKRKLIKETYIAQGQYEKRIIEIVSPDVHNLILENHLKVIFSEAFSRFEKILNELIKPPSLLNFLLGLDSDMLVQQSTNLTELLAKNIYNNKANDLGLNNLNITELTTNLFTPGYRELFYMYYIVKFLGVEKYIVINPHNLQVDTILSWFLCNIKENNEKIIEYTGQQFVLFLKEKIIKRLENATEMNQEIIDIMKEINKITTLAINRNNEYFPKDPKTIYKKMDENINFTDPELAGCLKEYINQI